MKCPSCNHDNPPAARFCGNCRLRIGNPTEAIVSAGLGQETPGVGGAELASIPRRSAALLLDGTIGLFTLYVGWIVWSFFVFGRGQTPGKKLVGIYAARVNDPHRPLSWGSMFMREIVVKTLLFGCLLGVITLGVINILDPLWALFDGSGQRRTLHDKVIKGSVYRKQGS